MLTVSLFSFISFLRHFSRASRLAGSFECREKEAFVCINGDAPNVVHVVRLVGQVSKKLCKTPTTKSGQADPLHLVAQSP